MNLYNMLAKCNMNISIVMHFKGIFVNGLARNYEQFVKTLSLLETFLCLKLSFIYLFAIIIKAEMLFTLIRMSTYQCEKRHQFSALIGDKSCFF